MHDHGATKVSGESLHEGYEVSDMQPGLIAGCLVALGALTIASLVAIIIVMRGFDESRPPMNTDPKSPLAAQDVFSPDAPPLQQSPEADRATLFAEAEAKLNGYGWVSQEPGMERAHIPVDVAIRMMAEGKAPYRQQPQAAIEPSAAQGAPAPAPAAPAH